MRRGIVNLFVEFTQSERNAGIVLMVCSILSLILANSVISEAYVNFWHQKMSFSFLNFEMTHTLEEWINDGLMTIFFLLVGLEIERELYEGELHPIKNAIVPIAAAIGGMVMPAVIYTIVNFNSPDTLRGFGIPMATDIAFSLAVLSLVANRVPLALKVLLTSLAIIDDLGSIIVIAVFYGKDIHYFYLMGALGIFLILLIMNKLKIYRLTPYLLLGIVMWYCMLKSGIHATLSGVLLAFALPFNYRGEKNPSIRLQEMLHIPVAFLVLPIFTLANTAIPLNFEYINSLSGVHAIGIALGLIAGKPLGILLGIYLVVRLKIVQLPNNVNWYQLLALGMSAGIGFTMSIFFAQLAFNDDVLIQSSKMMILISSCFSGWMAYLMFVLKKPKTS
ncbi:MAG: Na(+)/H(+) antiporter NhaA [Bacteroidia bacterium]|nr:MAG: Na(+)/H(+) antiporter NhaA [Bacteroidia bacterium]